MRKPLLAAAVAVAFLVPPLMTAGPAGAASFAKCSGSYAPDGSPGGGFYSRIKAKRISCAAAKKVTLTWIKLHASGAENPTRTVKVLGYTCKGRSVSSPGDPNGGLSVLCVRSAKAVSFYGHP